MGNTVKRIVLIGAMLIAGVAGAKSKEHKQAALQKDAADAQAAMLQKDPGLQTLLNQSAGYIIFPKVKEGGFIVGGAGATGVVFEHGQPVGQAKLSRVSVGAQVGGQKYAELIAFRDKAVLDKTKAGDMDLGAQASAIILKSGGGTSASFGDKGIVVIMDPKGGAMVSAAVKGQRIRTTM